MCEISCLLALNHRLFYIQVSIYPAVKAPVEYSSQVCFLPESYISRLILVFNFCQLARVIGIRAIEV